MDKINYNLAWEKIHKAKRDFNLLSPLPIREECMTLMRIRTRNWTRDITLHDINVARQWNEWLDQGLTLKIGSKGLMVLDLGPDSEFRGKVITNL